MGKVTVDNIAISETVPFAVGEGEVVAYALEEAGLLGGDTLINDAPARILLAGFYDKRDRFRENSRLGQLMVNEFGITREQLVEALRYHELNGTPLGAAFIKLEICDRATIDRALSRQVSMRKHLR